MEPAISQVMESAAASPIAQQLGAAMTQTQHAIATGASQTKAAMTDLGSTATKLPQQALESTVQKWIKMFELMTATWMQDHPIAAWFLTHPIISLIGLLVMVVLLRGLLGAIAHLTERIWLAVLRLPVTIVTRSVSAVMSLVNRPAIAATLPEEPSPQKRLTLILDRLEALRREQDELLQEVRTMLSTEP